MRHPAAPPALVLLLGVVTGALRPASWEPGAAVMAGAWGCAVVAFCQRETRTFTCAALVACWCAGWTLASLDTDAALHTTLRASLIAAHGPGAVQDEAGDPVEITARLSSDAVRLPSGVMLDLAVTSVMLDGQPAEVEGGVLITVGGVVPPERFAEWRGGRVVRLPVLLRRPARYLNPGVPDHETSLARRGATLVGAAKSALLVEVIERGSPMSEAAAAIRADVRLRIDSNIGRWDPRSGAIVKAILLGDRAGLDDETELRLQQAGTYHVLAISGGNVAILAGLLIVTLRAVRLGRRMADLLAAVLLVFYACLVGGGASVERATLMAVAYLCAHAVDHDSRPLNCLALAGGIGLARGPLGLFDPAFWLTFGATGAILVGVPRLQAALNPRPAILRQAWLLFGASLSAEVALFPVAAYAFSRVTFAGLVLNFLAIPLMTAVQIGGLFSLALSYLQSSWAGAAGYCAHISSWALVESAGLVQLAPWLSHRLAPPGPIAMACYFAGWLGYLAATSPRSLGSRALALERWLPRAALGVAAVAAMWILRPPDIPGASNKTLRVTFLDVGQGDGALLQLPSGFTLLVDAGGAGGSSFDIGQRVIEPVLWERGVRRLDFLIVTHGDGDHLNGAAPVVRDFRPREMWEGVPVPRLVPLQDLRAAADRSRVSWRVIQRGDLLHLGPVELHAWHPPIPDWERQKVRNDDSIVLEVRYGDVSILLAGDVGPAIEAELARAIPPASLRVLKAPHHGSITSNTPAFVSAVSPSAVVVSVGRGNRFGHPAPAVIRRYQDAGALVFRTDQDGAVTLETDGRRVDISTFTGRRGRLEAARVPPA